MSINASAQLSYGHLLGGGEHPWNIAGLGEDQPWCPAWLDGADINEADPVDNISDRLLAVVAGFTEEWHSGIERSFYGRKEAALEQVGVTLDVHGHHDFIAYRLVAHSIDAYLGAPTMLLPAGLELQREQEGWDAKLDAALAALDITPTMPRGWLLTASYI